MIVVWVWSYRNDYRIIDVQSATRPGSTSLCRRTFVFITMGFDELFAKLIHSCRLTNVFLALFAGVYPEMWYRTAGLFFLFWTIQQAAAPLQGWKVFPLPGQPLVFSLAHLSFLSRRRLSSIFMVTTPASSLLFIGAGLMAFIAFRNDTTT